MTGVLGLGDKESLRTIFKSSAFALKDKSLSLALKVKSLKVVIVLGLEDKSLKVKSLSLALKVKSLKVKSLYLALKDKCLALALYRSHRSHHRTCVSIVFI